ISGNSSFAIDLNQSTGALVQGNFLGTDASGTTDLGNGDVDVLAGAGAASATIGGTTTGTGNVIALTRIGANGFGGEGVAVGGTGGISILGNSIFGNAGLGISIPTNPPTFVPNLTSATAMSISGNLTGTPSTTYHVEFFASPDTGAINDGAQGKTFLG